MFDDLNKLLALHEIINPFSSGIPANTGASPASHDERDVGTRKQEKVQMPIQSLCL